MGEPRYKQTMPYVPIEVKTHRDAYAATLHVLFKHIADFHLCVVKTFSKKYGIPEDEIIQTIQESPEFKNMEIDPVLHTVHNDPAHNAVMESLGYKTDVITTIPKKRIVKKKTNTDTDVTITEPPPIPEQILIPEQIQQDTEIQPLAKKRVVKKKQVPAIESVAVASESVAVAIESVARERESDQAPVSSSEKKKVIKKTTAQPPIVAAPIDAVPIVAVPIDAVPIVAAPLVAAPLVKPKIIKKLKTT